MSEKQDCGCGRSITWAALPIIGFMRGESDTSALELRNCPHCKTTLSQAVRAGVLEAHVRAIPDKTQQSAALVLIAMARQRAAPPVPGDDDGASAPLPFWSAGDDDASGSFLCDHGRTLDEPCDSCERIASTLRRQAYRKAAGR